MAPVKKFEPEATLGEPAWVFAEQGGGLSRDDHHGTRGAFDRRAGGLAVLHRAATTAVPRGEIAAAAEGNRMAKTGGYRGAGTPVRMQISTEI